MKPSLNVLFLACASLAGQGLAAESWPGAADAPVYVLKQAVVGSNLVRPVVSGPVPFDKPYADLSVDQRQVVRRDYESLGPEDEPPFPEHGLRGVVTPISRLAAKVGVDGRLEVAVDVDPGGNGRAVSVFRSPDDKVSQMASLALMQEKYKPARCKGQPCAMSFVLHVDLLKQD